MTLSYQDFYEVIQKLKSKAHFHRKGNIFLFTASLTHPPPPPRLPQTWLIATVSGNFISRDVAQVVKRESSLERVNLYENQNGGKFVHSTIFYEFSNCLIAKLVTAEISSWHFTTEKIMFSIRIVNSDFYVATPIPDLDVCNSAFRETATNKVPVIRIYGATPNGQKTCLHVHGVFPYIYVPYDGTQPTDKYVKQFAISVDFAVQVALGKASSSRQHVYEISVVKGM